MQQSRAFAAPGFFMAAYGCGCGGLWLERSWPKTPLWARNWCGDRKSLPNLAKQTGTASNGITDRHNGKKISLSGYRGWAPTQDTLYNNSDAHAGHSKSFLPVQHFSDGHLVRRSSNLCDRDSTLATKASLPSVRGASLNRMGIQSCLSGIATGRNNAFVIRTSRLPIEQFGVPLCEQALVGSMYVTTSAWMESASTPLYSKRRKKRRRVAHAAKPSIGETEQEGHSVKKAEEKSVVVVESPAKAKTIQKYLEGKYVVLPSFGHVRDLAAKSGSVRPDEDFRMVWEVPSSARQHLNTIKAAVKGAHSLVLASDPDREGEAIAWHVLEMLKMEGSVRSDLKVRRVVFNEITKAAVMQAMEAPRDISSTLVEAYLARRALDYLIGFDLSPVLWRKLPGSKSAGRVQSAALRLVSERELEIEAFTPQEFWTIDVEVSLSLGDIGSITASDNFTKKANTIPAKVTHVDGDKLSQFSLASKESAETVSQRVRSSKFEVSSVKKSMVRRNPPAPFITSTLQQEASNKLGFGVTRTMALAQQLYEGVKLDNNELTGLITYMRTDSVHLSSEAIRLISSFAARRYGVESVPPQPRQFASKVKNAQEAHEAIRPTDVNRLPSMMAHVLEEDALRLYSLIWGRTVACQMEQAIFAQVCVDIKNDTEDLQLRANGSSLSSPGYLTAYKDKMALPSVKEVKTDEDEDLQGHEGKLWSLEAGDVLTLNDVQSNQHFTEPPPRFSEGSLVRRLEELGIGRPSTYASTLRTLQTRNYIRIENRRIFPEARGRMVSAFLSHYFPKFSDYEFTANLETQLDEVSAGRADWKTILADFWPEFHEGVSAVLKIPIEEVVELLEDVFVQQFFSGSKERACPSCGEGKMGLKLSRFGQGYFLGCNRYPNCMYRTSVLSAEGIESSDDEENTSLMVSPSKSLGVDPASGLEVILKIGPYGKYIQVGTGSKKQKPKRSAIPKEMKADDIDLSQALELLKYPIELGKHPETNTPILMSIGQYGHYLRCRGVFVSLPKDLFPGRVSLEQAVDLLKSKHVSKCGRKPQAQDSSSPKNQTIPDKKSTNVKTRITKGKASTASSKKSISSASTETKEQEKKTRLEVKKKSEEVSGKQPITEGIAREIVEEDKKSIVVEMKRPRGRPRKLQPERQVTCRNVRDELQEVKSR